MVEGELPVEGLAALEGGGRDVILALARRLTEYANTGDRRQSLEVLFADAQRSTEEADDLLVEGSWDGAIESERELVVVAGQPTAVTDGTLGGLPLFTAAATLPPRETAPPTGNVVTFAELAAMLRRPEPRRKVAPEGQLALFGS